MNTTEVQSGKVQNLYLHMYGKKHKQTCDNTVIKVANIPEKVYT